jgi:hypothetical protein
MTRVSKHVAKVSKDLSVILLHSSVDDSYTAICNTTNHKRDVLDQRVAHQENGRR